MTQSYKNVDAGWIKEIPVEWDLKKVKEVYEFVSVKVNDTDYPALTVSSKYGITPQMEHVAKTLNGDSRKRVEKGDFVINSRADRPGACGISAYDGSVSMICHVLKPRVEGQLNNKYMHYLFRNNMFSQEFFRWGRGIVSDLWSTRKDEFGNLQLPIPPLNVQKVIGKYIECKEKNINALIHLKEVELEKLNEQRKSIITEVVTKGLNPNVKMKDSGVEWIGEIPEHWLSTQVKYAFSVVLGKMLQPQMQYSTDILAKYLKVNNVQEGYVDETKVDEMYASPEDFKIYSLKSGDLLVCEGGDVGRSALLDKDYEKFVFQKALNRVRGTSKGHNPYLHYLLNLVRYSDYMSILVNKATIPHFTREKLMGLKVCLPPMEEQIQIANHISSKENEIQALKVKLQIEISKLKEYRQVLIYEAVTGKIDVRDMELD